MTLILGIESSCDESACAVVRDGVEVLSNAVASQIARYAAHGGVVPELADLAASFQEAVVDVLVRKALKAIKDFQVKTLVTAGGVACNARLRERLQAEVPKNVQLLLAPPAYCTDNAAMIGGLGYYHYLADNGRGDGFGFDAFARLPEITAIRFAGQKYPVEG